MPRNVLFVAPKDILPFAYRPNPDLFSSANEDELAIKFKWDRARVGALQGDLFQALNADSHSDLTPLAGRGGNQL